MVFSQANFPGRRNVCRVNYCWCTLRAEVLTFLTCRATRNAHLKGETCRCFVGSMEVVPTKLCSRWRWGFCENMCNYVTHPDGTKNSVFFPPNACPGVCASIGKPAVCRNDCLRKLSQFNVKYIWALKHQAHSPVRAIFARERASFKGLKSAKTRPEKKAVTKNGGLMKPDCFWRTRSISFFRCAWLCDSYTLFGWTQCIILTGDHCGHALHFGVPRLV